MSAIDTDDLAATIIEYENGQLGEADIIDLFQLLAVTGLAWMLQGHYGREAYRFIQAGLISPDVSDKRAG